MFADKNIYSASTTDASALGAAMVLQMKSLTGGRGRSRSRSRIRKVLELTRHEPFAGINIDHYSWADPVHQI